MEANTEKKKREGINFILRSKIEDKRTFVYFRYRPSSAIDLMIKTPFSVLPLNWDSENCRQINPYEKTTPREASKKLDKKLIETFNQSLDLFEADFKFFLMTNPTAGKDQIRKYINDKYFPKSETKSKTKKTTEINDAFIICIEQYIKDKSRRIEGKQDAITQPTVKKLTTIKNNISQYNKNIKLQDINDDFRDNYTIYLQKSLYSPSTIIKDLKYIKTVCKHHSKKMKVHTDVLTWEFKAPRITYNYPFLNFSEIEMIQNTIYPHDYLENAKDWLIIGLYTGVRVSDLLNFTSSKIVEKEYLEFRQKKIENQTNDATEVIYLHPEVMKILAKRNGEFPRKISDQKFNIYIKEVAKIAGLTQKMIGGKIDEKTKKKKIEEYEKWELVTSHIMRRSYVSNFLKIIGIDNVKVQTGHRTSEIVGKYDHTAKLDRAKQVKQQFENLKIVQYG